MRRLRTTLAAAAAAIALAPGLARAAVDTTALPDAPKAFSPLVGFAFTTGGTPLVHVIIVNQDDGSYMGSTSVKAGGQDYLYLGAEWRPGRGRFALQGTAGYHWNSKGGNDLDVTFSRVPLELVGLYQVLPQLRVGAGVRYDTRVHMTGKGTAAGLVEADFDNALGAVIKAEWMVLPDTGIELRWTKIDYKVRTYDGTVVDARPGNTVDGRSFGMGLNLHF